ncbi:MAG: glycosyltransferase family 39 protein [Chloroflexi bacterium]|nr:glycosyltransferase family 39 protein [Chloroflexota bacterium]
MNSIEIRATLAQWLRAARPALQDTHRLLWIVFLVLYGLRAFGLGVPDSFNLWFIALILGLLGLALTETADKQPQLSRVWVIGAFLFALAIRSLPYIDNQVPLGFDPGLYKALFERPNDAVWSGIYPLPFTLLMHGLTAIFGFTIVNIPIFILVTSLTALVLYREGRRLFGQDAGIVAALLFSVSITQFDLFQLNYYKNAFGIIFLVFALHTLDDANRLNWGLILLGTLVAGMHQLALALFGLAYALHWLMRFRETSWRERLWVAANGFIILGLTLLTNYDRVDVYIFGQASRFLRSVSEIQLGGTANAGQYLDTIVYFNFNAPLLALGLPGLLRARQSRSLVVATLVLAAIIGLKLFFYRRFLIYFDIFLILFAAIGWLGLFRSSGLTSGGAWGRWAAMAVLVLMGVHVANRSLDTKPLIQAEELAEIDALDTLLPPEASLLTLDPSYATWAVGWTGFEIIAPTMLNDDYSAVEWQMFRRSETAARLQFLEVFPRPLYLLVSLEDSNLTPFQPECFQEIRLEYFAVYEVICE